MRISRRSSGKRDSENVSSTGRGEYEISETSAEGYSPADIVNRVIHLDFGDELIINTGSSLQHRNGKWRIRLTHGAKMRPHAQLAAVLMMPQPVQEDRRLGRGQPVMRTGEYAIEHIHLDQVEMIDQDAVRLRIHDVELQNASNLAHDLNVRNRVRNVRLIWESADKLPEDLAPSINQHRVLSTRSGPILDSVSAIVADLQHALTVGALDYGILQRGEGEDVVPDLVRIIGEADAPPEPALTVQDIEPEAAEIRRRVIKEWKRWANSRGPASTRFRRAVRSAYKSTCVVCGIHLPPTSFNSTPGVDAAHILPWSKVELDHVSNGVCLCKIHHWAFDEGLIEIRFENGVYSIEVPAAAVRGLEIESPEFSLDKLRAYVGPIPQGRLPVARAHRPDPRFLEQLREYS